MLAVVSVYTIGMSRFSARSRCLRSSIPQKLNLILLDVDFTYQLEFFIRSLVRCNLSLVVNSSVQSGTMTIMLSSLLNNFSSLSKEQQYAPRRCVWTKLRL